MKKISCAVLATAMLFASCNDETASTDGPTAPGNGDSATATIASEKKAWVPVDSATAMQKMMEVATPGEPHKILAASDGKWIGETTMWMEKGGAPAQSTTKMDNKMIMDGRYQVSTSSGDMGGMQFMGTATTGYDNYKKKYVSTWIDNMGTGIINMEGTMDPATKTITFIGTYPNPANGSVCEMKEVYRMVDDRHAVMEIWGSDMKTGESYKNMEMKLTKQ